ncbi:hypothetical protein AAIG97_31945, partial [Pseudomonas aeruginosa]|uniref:hypothetical protein n=1 Tax=Pseudomonas aeruginosa TaxID=287 RepID=UPI0031B7C236
ALALFLPFPRRRGTAALLMYRHRYAREEGLGNVFIGKIDGRQTCVTLGLAAIFAAVLLPGMHGVAAMVVTMVAIFILVRTRSGIDFCGTGKDSGVKRVGSAWRTDPCIAGGSMCGQPRDCRIIDVSSSL